MTTAARTRNAAAAAGRPPFQFNSANIQPTVVLSNGNRTAVLQDNVNDAACGIPASARAGGKVYFEWDYTRTGSYNIAFVGVCRHDANLTNVANRFYDYPDDSVYPIAVYAYNGKGYENAVLFTGSQPSIQQRPTHIAQVALDIDARRFYYGVNNTWYAGGNPAAGTGGKDISGFTGSAFVPFAHAVNGSGTSIVTITLFTSASTQTYAPPTGYVAWDGPLS